MAQEQFGVVRTTGSVSDYEPISILPSSQTRTSALVIRSIKALLSWKKARDSLLRRVHEGSRKLHFCGLTVKTSLMLWVNRQDFSGRLLLN